MELNVQRFEGQLEAQTEDGRYARLRLMFDIYLAPESNPDLLPYAGQAVIACMTSSYLHPEARLFDERDFYEPN